MNCCELMDASVYLTKEVGNPFEAYPNKIDCFTKSELAKIMGGAIYKRAGENFVREGSTDVYDDNEWINPLIKLVPVEDGE
ncbi:hypothetical protein [Lactococcus lactis]|uniref:hypothetical protein n=1 Tax=Lactococcus lactis TaxID=1358 RepID=UPI0024A8B5A4|nr:hypothetical protein [Lactococcus lactis]